MFLTAMQASPMRVSSSWPPAQYLVHSFQLLHSKRLSQGDFPKIRTLVDTALCRALISLSTCMGRQVIFRFLQVLI